MLDLIETVTTSETPLAAWFDPQSKEVGVQYGYVLISLPLEDFHDLVEALEEARKRLPQ